MMSRKKAEKFAGCLLLMLESNFGENLKGNCNESEHIILFANALQLPWPMNDPRRAVLSIAESLLDGEQDETNLLTQIGGIFLI